MTLDEFEKQVMSALLAGEDPVLETLRAQYAAATVRDREMEHNGFITRFEVPSSVPPINRKVMHLDDLQVQLEGAATPADTSLRIHNGRIRSLEVFVYGGEIPAAPVIQAAWYYGTERFPAITKELMAERDVESVLEEES